MVSAVLRSALLALLTLPALAIAAEAVPDAPPLTLPAAVQLAASQSRLLEAGDLQASAAREMAVAAGRLPDPVLKLGINNLPVNGEDRFSVARDFMTMRSVGVMQEFTRDDKRQARRGRWEKEAETAEATRALALTKLQQSTALAWLERYYQEHMAQLLSRQRSETRLQVDAAEAAYRSGGGRGSLADVFAARSAVAQLEDRLAMVQRQVAVAKTQLARWVGKAAAEQRLAEPPATYAVNLNDATLDTQLLHHPEIALMEKQEAVAQADADLARTNTRADWSVELMASQRGPAYSKMVSINLSIPLQWDHKNRQDRELAAKLATVAQLRAEREDAVRAHVAEVHGMLQELQGNRDRLKRYDESLLPLTAERTQAAMAAYRGGANAGGNLAAVLEARRAEIDMRLERLRLDLETARLWAQLNYLTHAADSATVTQP